MWRALIGEDASVEARSRVRVGPKRKYQPFSLQAVLSWPVLWAVSSRHLMWKILYNFESHSQIWLEIMTSRDVKSTSLKGSRRHVMWSFLGIFYLLPAGINQKLQTLGCTRQPGTEKGKHHQISTSVLLETPHITARTPKRLMLSHLLTASDSRHRIWPGEGSTIQRKWSQAAPGNLKAPMVLDLLK